MGRTIKQLILIDTASTNDMCIAEAVITMNVVILTSHNMLNLYINVYDDTCYNIMQCLLMGF